MCEASGRGLGLGVLRTVLLTLLSLLGGAGQDTGGGGAVVVTHHIMYLNHHVLVNIVLFEYMRVTSVDKVRGRCRQCWE